MYVGSGQKQQGMTEVMFVKRLETTRTAGQGTECKASTVGSQQPARLRG